MRMPPASLLSLLEQSIGGVWGKAPGEDEIDVQVLRVTELRPGGRLDPSTAALRSVSRRQLASRRLQAGDLILEKSGGGPTTPVGRVALVTELLGPSVCSNFMQLMRPRENAVEPRYLHLYLNHLHSTGGTIPLQTSSTNIRNIKTSDYFEVAVPVPAIGEQRRIVDLLEQHLSHVEDAERSVASAKRRLNLLRASSYAQVFHSASGRQTTLGDVARWGSGGTPKTSQPDYYGGSIPWVISGDLRDGPLGEVAGRITDEGLRASSAKWVPPNAVLVAMYGATIGRAAITTQAVTTNQAVAHAVPVGDSVSSEYLFWFVLSERPWLVRVGQGGAQPNISQTVLKNWPVVIPSIDDQKDAVMRLESLAESIDRQVSTLVNVSRRGQAMRRALLQAAFSGRLTSGTSDDELEGLASTI